MLAIFSEVAGTSSMKVAGSGGSITSYLVMYILISISYYFLALAAKRISIGVAYACWEGLGIALITVVSIFYFDSPLMLQEIIGLAMVVAGVVMVTLGEEHAKPEPLAGQDQQRTHQFQVQ
ncbi:multidrug transporter subunit MdtJ [Paraferrimonas sedimenticola]|uniref:Spermidine export protein MdtJ n=2 Tax=Paraferrimonas sedimenticola TaxID=375674 RepID=A0AA37W2P4_9GAMM|nr:multidrug transporter subunit MdtJ [Paraferrimonas sedimenticola]